MEEIQQMLEDIDESLRSHYYPFILEDIDNFYDQIKDICTQSNSLSTLLNEIHQDSNQIFQFEKDVGKEIEITAFEQLVSDVNDKIVLYQQKEKDLIRTVTLLYNDVKLSMEGCDSDIRNTMIPLSEKEAEVILAKQNATIASLKAEKGTYEKRCQELETRLQTLQAENKAKGIPSPLATLECRAATHKSLLWLYSLKRIMRHSFGLFDIQSEGKNTNITFEDGRELMMETDENNKLCSAKINWSMPQFDELVSTSLGGDWNTFVVDLMYAMYSSRRYTNELNRIRQRYVVNEGQDGQIRIVFPNCMVVDLQLPLQYPRTIEQLEVKNVDSVNIDRLAVYDVKSMLRNKQFFTLTDFVEFVEQVIM